MARPPGQNGFRLAGWVKQSHGRIQVKQVASVLADLGFQCLDLA